MTSSSKRSERIRVVIGSLDVGGAERHLVQILPKLSAMGFSVVVIVITHRGALADELENQGIKVIGPGKFVQSIRQIRVLGSILAPVIWVSHLMRRFREHRADITCLYLPSAYILGMLAQSLVFQNTLTIMFRRSLNAYQKKHVVLGLLERQLHKRVHRIVGNSAAIIRQLKDDERVDGGKLTLIHNGVDLRLYSNVTDRNQVRSGLGISSEETVIILVANLIPYKGHKDLICALGEVAKTDNSPWTLLCVGSGIEKRRDLVGLVTSLKLNSRVKWLGLRTDIPDILSASDIGLLISHEEGFANAILEGMAAGLPMIVTDVGGNREAVRHEQTGLIVPPRDPQQLAQAICDLLKDSEKCRRFGEAGRRRATEKFSLAACVSRYAQLFDELARDCRSPKAH